MLNKFSTISRNLSSFISYISLVTFCLLASNTLSAQCECEPILDQNINQITVATVGELEAAMDLAFNNNGNTTIRLQPGVYTLNENLRGISDNMSNLIITGATDNRDDVTIEGLGWNNSSVTHIFNVYADNVTIANMTIGKVILSSDPSEYQSNRCG